MRDATTPMNHSISAPPEGSCFVVDVDEESRPRLSWLGPTGGCFRYGAAAFLGFWLCGWAVGEVTVIGILTGLLFGGWGGPAQQGGDLCGGLFLIVWLGGWTVGGFAAMFAFYNLVRRPRPERVVLGSNSLFYDPGTSNLFPVSRYETAQWRRTTPWKRSKPRIIPREAVGRIVLERVGERQRLSVDVGADRVEIGPTLMEPEREWLADVLRAWAGSRSA